ncbi:MAG: PAS domain S-box protein, partial [Desulfobacterales bacterium]
REQYLSFTTPYISSPYVIFAREQKETLLDISGLSGKTLGVPKGFIIQQFLERDYPEIRLVLFENDEQSLVALSSGKVDAYIGNLTMASHLIQKRGLSNLRVVAPTPYGDQVLSMGNRNDWPELTTIIDKALASITEAEKTDIRNKYVALRVEQGINRAAVFKWALIVSGSTLGIVFLFVFWNRSLAKKVRQRTDELESSNESLVSEVVERTKAEKALRESRNYLENLTNSLPDAVFLVKMPERVIEWANGTDNVLGYEPGECVGKTTEFLYPDRKDFIEFGDKIQRAIAAGDDIFHIEQTLKNKSGDLFPVDTDVSLFRIDQSVVSVTAIVRDISDRKKAEEALKESEEKFRHLVEQSPLSIQVFNLDGQIIQVNEAWKKLWGLAEERLPEVFEKYNVIEDEKGEELGVLPLIDKAFKGEMVTLPVLEYDASITMENLKIVGAEGNKRWIEARFSPIKNSSGEVVNVVAIEEDITNRKRAEQEIQLYQERLKALAAQLTIAEEKERRRIAADLHDHVGHSLALARMQLNGILESDSDLERTILVKDVSNIMLRALQETRSLIFELSTPSMDDIGLGAAISEWLEEQIEKRHGLKTECSGTIAKKHQKTLDENVQTLLFRSVRELLTNVVKHARANTVAVHLGEHDNDISITIEDDGIGFDRNALKSNHRQKGGFGLFSIQERMTNMGGTFDIQSEPGKGCRVVLTVPVGEGRKD